MTKTAKSRETTPNQIHELAVSAFNDAYPVGTAVEYWTGGRQGEPAGIAKTATPAYLLAGEIAVVCLEDVMGCINLFKVKAVSHG
jgi:hypothetical protein